MKPFYPYLLSLALTFTASAEVINENNADDNPHSKLAGLSIDEVTRAVLENNRSIQSAERKWSGMKARIPQAAAWNDPKISFEEKLDRFVSVQPNAFADQIVSVEQMIPLSGKNRSRARAAAAEAVVSFEELRRRELDLIAKARGSYIRLANVYAQIELNRKNLVSLKEMAEISRAKYEVGDQSAAFVLSAEVEYSKLLEARRDLDRQLSSEESQLNVLMNRDAFAPVGRPSEANLETALPPVQALRELTLSHRPEVRMALAKVEQAKAILQLAHREWIPDPAVNVQAQRYNGAAQGASELDAGISFNVPWLNYRKYSAEFREADENLHSAQNDLESARNEATGILRDALQNVETGHHHVELLRDKLIPQAKQAFEASQLSYETGKAGFLEWITAQRNLRDLESMDRQNLADYQVALAGLEAVIGSPVNSRSAASFRTTSK